jgi:CRISPR-associated protein Cas2
MLYLISYDIEDDKKRTRLAHKLKDFGRRVQYSVFEADINEQEVAELQKLLANVQLGKNDSLRLYRLCGECLKQIKIWGKGEVTQDRDFYIA